MLLHGLGVSGRYLLPAAELFAERRQVMVPDLPGWGRSSDPPTPLGITGLAAALGTWADAVGLEHAWFAGHSLGAQIVTALAVDRPELVAGLVLSGPTPDPRARSVSRIAIRLATDLPREPPRLWPLVAQDYLRYGPRKLLHTLRELLADPFETRLAHVRAPTLVVRGANDPICSRAWAEHVADLVGADDVHTVAGGHTPHYGHPAAFVETIERAVLGQPVE